MTSENSATETSVTTDNPNVFVEQEINDISTDNENKNTPHIENEMDLLLDINVTVAIELGSKVIKLKELVELGKNSVIELNKAAGSHLDIKANNTLIARGEVVVVNGRYGIRLTEIISAADRKRNN